MPDIDLYEHYPMKRVTTFRIGGSCRYLAHIHSVNELFEAIHFSRTKTLPFFILGGGSNTLVSDRGFPGLVIKMVYKGIEVVKETSEYVIVKVAAGENWDQFVAWAGEQGWWGLENLSYIPGNTGALAIQNVGAYGQDAGQVIESLGIYNVATGERKRLTAQECRFAYRQSIFNSTSRGRYIILDTSFRLLKNGRPNLRYLDLRKSFDEDAAPDLHSIRQAVIRIRQEKLPEPEQIGNAGSFFKNCVLSAQEFESCCQRVRQTLGKAAYESLRYKTRPGQGEQEERKLPTALLLDVCGAKTFRHGGAALYHKHPLIVVNHSGNATARDIMELTRHIRQVVFQKTGIALKPEPHLLGFSAEEMHEYFGS